MRIKAELSREDLERLIIAEFCRNFGRPVSSTEIRILVKSRQNWKAEWEDADFKAEMVMVTEEDDV